MKASLCCVAALACAVSAAVSLHSVQAATPKVTEVKLYSAGLAEIRQQAAVVGNEGVELTVPLGQVDDILKSLVVRDPSGSVVSIGLPGREPLSEAFRYLPFDKGELGDLRMLLTALQGRSVTVEGRGQMTQGRIVGVQREEGPEGETRHRVTLISEDGAVSTFVMEAADAITFDDPEVREMITSALAATQEARSADTRNIAIALEGSGARDVDLAYVVEAPVWKAAYRLVLPKGDGEARLQGWAVVENMTGQDWEGVKLSLTSGRPVALRQALYETYRLTRPEIPVSAFGRLLPRPDGGALGVTTTVQGSRASGTRSIPGPLYGSQEQLLTSYANIATSDSPGPAYMASTSQAVAVDESMTSVRFDFPQPMNVPAGHSLTVPFIDGWFHAERVSIYQPDVDETHPIAAVRVHNAGESSLPPGILTFYDGAEGYAGDAQFLGAGPEESRLLTFAVDRKVRITAEPRGDELLRRASVVDGVLRAESLRRMVTDYTIYGAADADRAVVIEHPRLSGWTTTVAGGEREETSSHIRVLATVAAGSEMKVTMVDEMPKQTQYFLNSMDERALVDLTGLLEGVDNDLIAALSELAEIRVQMAEAERSGKAASKELADISADQARVRSNLSSVPPESELARRYLALLAEQENLVETAKTAQAAAVAEKDAAEARLMEAVRKLSD